jgi:hypothetical protein
MSFLFFIFIFNSSLVFSIDFYSEIGSAIEPLNIEKQINPLYDLSYKVYLGNPNIGYLKNASIIQQITIKNRKSTIQKLDATLSVFKKEYDPANTYDLKDKAKLSISSNPLNLPSSGSKNFNFTINISNTVERGNHTGNILFQDPTNSSNYIRLSVFFEIVDRKGFNVIDGTLIRGAKEEETGHTNFKIGFSSLEQLKNNYGIQEFKITNTRQVPLNINLKYSNFTNETGGVLNGTFSFNPNSVHDIFPGEMKPFNFIFNVSKNNPIGNYTGTIFMFDNANPKINFTKKIRFIVTKVESTHTITSNFFEINKKKYTYTYLTQNYNISGTRHLINGLVYQNITFTNTGDLNLTLNISKSNFTSENGNKINITIDKTQLFVKPRSTDSFIFSYDINKTNLNFEDYFSQINLTNKGGHYSEKTITLDLYLNYSKLLLGKFEFEGSEVFEEVARGVSNSPFRFRIKNAGKSDLKDIKISIIGKGLIGKKYGRLLKEKYIDFDKIKTDLLKGTSKLFSGELDISQSLVEDEYIGKILIKSGYVNLTIPINISVKENDISLIVENFNYDINKHLYLEVTPTKIQAGVYFFLKNSERNKNVEGLKLEIKNFSNKNNDIISSDNFLLSYKKISLYSRDSKRIKLTSKNLLDFKDGTYHSSLLIKNSENSILKIIPLILKIKKNLVIDKVILNGGGKIISNGYLNVKTTLKNFNVRTYSDIILKAYIQDLGTEKIVSRISNKMKLTGLENITEEFKFKLPKVIISKNQVLILNLSYKNSTGASLFLTESYKFKIIGNSQVIEITDVLFNKEIFNCENNLYSSFKIENIGDVNERIKVITRISNSDIKTTSNLFYLNSKEVGNFDFKSDISTLIEGTHNYEIIIEFENKNIYTKTKSFKIKKCSLDFSNNNFNQEVISQKEDKFFETEFSEYLISAVIGAIVILLLTIVFVN